jgi:hypothetical protein
MSTKGNTGYISFDLKTHTYKFRDYNFSFHKATRKSRTSKARSKKYLGLRRDRNLRSEPKRQQSQMAVVTAEEPKEASDAGATKAGGLKKTDGSVRKLNTYMGSRQKNKYTKNNKRYFLCFKGLCRVPGATSAPACCDLSAGFRNQSHGHP